MFCSTCLLVGCLVVALVYLVMSLLMIMGLIVFLFVGYLCCLFLVVCGFAACCIWLFELLL